MGSMQNMQMVIASGFIRGWSLSLQLGSGDRIGGGDGATVILPPPLLDDFDDVSIHTAPEELEFTYPDSTDSEPSGNTTYELPSLNNGSELSDHDENEIQQSEPMEIDEGVESYCYRCHLIYNGTAEQHDPECRQHGYCMTHQRNLCWCRGMQRRHSDGGFSL